MLLVKGLGGFSCKGICIIRFSFGTILQISVGLENATVLEKSPDLQAAATVSDGGGTTLLVERIVRAHPSFGEVVLFTSTTTVALLGLLS